MDGWLPRTQSEKQKKEKDKWRVCVCAYQLCVEEKSMSPRWFIDGQLGVVLLLLLLLLVNATQMPFTCVLKSGGGRWVYRAGGIDHHHSIFIARLNHSVDAALDLGEEEEEITKKWLPPEIFINSRVSRGLEKITSSPPFILDEGGESPVSIENHH